MTTRICFASGGTSTTARGSALPPSSAVRTSFPRWAGWTPAARCWLDSVTALLSNEMFRADGTLDADAPERLERELLAFSRQMRCCVFVSDYIYADGGQYDAWTEAYRRGLARLDRALRRGVRKCRGAVLRADVLVQRRV